MKLAEIASVTNPEEALARARAETPLLQDALQRASTLYEKYKEEHQRLIRLQQSVNEAIAEATAKLADATRRFCLRATAGESYDGFGEQLSPLEARKRFALSALSHVAEVAIPAAWGEVLKHKVLWLQSQKAIPEHSAVIRRLGSLVAVVGAIQQFDPGLVLDVTHTQSAVEMKEAEQWQREIDQVQQELQNHNATQRSN